MIERNHFVFIAENLRACLCAYSPSGEPLDFINRSLPDEDPPVVTDALYQALTALLPEHGIRTALVNKRYTYSVFKTPDKLLVLGPNKVINHLPFRYDVTVDDMAFLADEYLYSMGIDTYAQVLLPSYNLYYEELLSEEDYLTDNFRRIREEDVQRNYQDLLFRSREEQLAHNPYSLEKRMLLSIEQGDLQMLEECRRIEVIDRFGRISDNEERNFRDLSICAITLISRAAIRGGVNPELAFSLCDSYIMEIERLKNLYDLQPLTEKAKTNFCTMVKEIKDRKQNAVSPPVRNPFVEQTKDYIFSHLHKKVTLSEIAERLHINQNYLSELFTKNEGVPFSTFVMTEKLNLAKRMLVYTSYSYVDIANYLGFSSQSHLGKQFKARFGMTLREYRNQNSATEFQE